MLFDEHGRLPRFGSRGHVLVTVFLASADYAASLTARNCGLFGRHCTVNTSKLKAINSKSIPPAPEPCCPNYP